ncbi:ESS family glutamate:Na+ symporter [Kineosphaera limosa]|uniref:Sodium/glutamate symporter n=1 Tax=Kineosphaera limosa NBRC 100340 TaxID=1184609 RepID=K6WX95_9MICO|nr:hypothetical protein [Kineosphaera limosa]NYE01555.1 ESS family glutamate:Na+ symporter [Kineosphaera limosa]GAB96712.1 hypothetical protein KILIM_045_00430 [Kineosphaera limosa NBRC 100340]
MSPQQVGFALLILGCFLLLGKFIRVKSGVVQRLFLPSSIIAGTLMLLLGPDVLGRIAGAMGMEGWEETGLFTESMLTTWSALPGLLISVVFATLFLGQEIPTPKRAVTLVGPQLSLGVVFGAGQYVVGLLLAIFILVPLFAMTPMAGALIEIGFEGGHGTAAGMRGSLESLGFESGADLALGLATVGIVSGVILGIIFINWGVRRGHTEFLSGDAKMSVDEQKGLFAREEDYPAGQMTSRPSSVDTFSLHVGFVALSILIGWLMLSFFQWIEQMTYAETFELFEHVPLFPLALLGGVIVQVAMVKMGIDHLIDHEIMLRIQGLALDFLIVAALATLSLTAIGDNLGPFVILAVAGIVFNCGVFLLLAPRIIPRYWFERGIGDFGQSMGVTATGLILMRIADPDAKSPAFEAFGYKQLVFEPFFGGGLVTAAAVPLIYTFGPWPLLIAMTVVFLIALLSGLFYFGRRLDQAAEDEREVENQTTA